MLRYNQLQGMDEENLQILRHSCMHTDCSDRFKCSNIPCEKQYSNIYFVRSTILRQRMVCSAVRKWGSSYPVTELAKVKPGVRSCIIGMLYKNAPLRPNILKEVSEEQGLDIHPMREKYISESDQLILEDTLQRISLTGDINPHHFYTGTVIALAGMEERPGQFHVEDYTFVGLSPSNCLPIIDYDKYTMIVSGLEFGSKNEKMCSVQLMVDFLSGLVGNEIDQRLSSSIVHLIIAGNSMSSQTQDKSSQHKAKYLTYKDEPMTVSAMQEFDEVLAQLAAQVSVDVMSGEYDPANFLLPQQPLNVCMFRKASAYFGTSLHTVSNPYECDVEGVKFLGTSGQNIEDMRRCGAIDDSLELLQYTVRCGHIAPTAPDSLGCFPFYKTDPFIIQQEGVPHVYFAGNQPAFASRILEDGPGCSVSLVSVPSFHATQTAVLLNLRDLSCRPITFNA